MIHLKTYTDFKSKNATEEQVTEDFAQIGEAPSGNVSGMGAVVPPTPTSTGSGDVWNLLGSVSTQVSPGEPCHSCKKNGKKNKCKSCENKEKNNAYRKD